MRSSYRKELWPRIRPTTIIRWLSFAVIVTTFLPIFHNNLPPIIGSFHLWAPMFLLVTLILNPTLLANKQLYQLVVYGIVFILILNNTIWNEMIAWNKVALLSEFYFYCVALCMLQYYRVSKDYQGIALLSKWVLVFVGITAILTIYSSTIDPLYARKITSGVFSYESIMLFKRLGGAGYGYGSAIIPLFPIMIYYYKKNHLSIFPRWSLIVLILVSYIAVIRMQFFANVLIASLSIIVALLGSQNVKKSIIVIAIIGIAALLIPIEIYSKLLSQIGLNFEPESILSHKFSDFSDFLISEELSSNENVTDTGLRASRYPLLFKAFIVNPILGYYATDQPFNIASGNHLYWMSRLTIFGILGFGYFISIHLRYIKSSLKIFNPEYSFYYLISVGAVIILGLFKNLAGKELWITYFLVIPGLYYLPILKRTNNGK